MRYTISERQEAVENVAAVFNWYEEQKEGLGHDFLQELDTFYDSLEQNPEAYSYVDKPLRQGKINRFPYVVVFEVQQSSVVIFRVFNTHRDPSQKPSA